MKKILITGAGSYIGQSFENYLKQWKGQYQTDTLDMIGDGWRSASFAGYDAVFHVAGLVHLEKAKKDPAQAALYERVNTRLAVETAEKAKLSFSTYSPSSRAFTSMGSSSRPLICAQPVSPGRTSLAPYLSRSAIRSY